MKPYICNNAPRPSADLKLLVQDGWHDMGDHYDNEAKSFRMTRMPRMKVIPFINSVECQYDKGEVDPRCSGCEHVLKLSPRPDYGHSINAAYKEDT